MSTIQEKFLLVQIRQQQDAASFSKLYEMLSEPIYRFIYFKVDDQDLAQDLTAEVFLKCWKELTAQERSEVKHLRAFVYTIARNVVIDFYRSKENRQSSQSVGLDQVQDHPLTDAAYKAVEAKIESEQLLVVLKRLKSSYQEVIVLRHVEGLSLKEISQVMKRTPTSTRVLLHRANQALKREYDQTSSTT